MPREEAGTEPGLLREQSQIPRNKKELPWELMQR